MSFAKRFSNPLSISCSALSDENTSSFIIHMWLWVFRLLINDHRTSDLAFSESEDVRALLLGNSLKILICLPIDLVKIDVEVTSLYLRI